MNSRRIFIQQAGLIAAGLLIRPNIACTPADASGKVGLQLYTLRDQISKDVKGVIEKVAKAGYTWVETYGYTAKGLFWGLNPGDFKKLLDDNGLSSPSGHYDFIDYFTNGSEDTLRICIEAAKTLNQEYLTVPFFEEPFRKTVADFKKIASRLNTAAEICQESGLKLAYHNHDFEFHPIDGTTGYQILLDETDPSLVKLEADLYWLVRAGLDPVKLFEQHPGRFVMWHVKDMDKADRTINTEVGSGSIDFKRIFAEAKTSGLEYIFVEQENFSIDPYKSISASFSYVKNSLLPVKR